MRRRPRNLLRKLLWAVVTLIVLAAATGTTLWFVARDAMGGALTVHHVARAERSPQWRDGKFRNRLPRADGSYARMLGEFMFGGSDYRTPSSRIAVVRRTRADYQGAPISGLRTTWLGHSTLLLEIDGQRVLIDPVWGERASPFSFMGPKRFFEPPLPLSELPEIDAVVISHDHYDHLDMPTVKALVSRNVRWIVPLGVGAHLRKWGIKTERITELDWWDATTVGGLTITATPARHFSGRGLTDAGRTLWAGFAIVGATHRVFYSGDTALHDEFAEIGRRLGPFNLTMIEAGAYDELWVDVHLGPEQAVLAHQLVRGDVMLPVHWGLFDLALHGWTEPMERVLVAAELAGVRVAAPRPGDMVEPSQLGQPVRWWPQTPWETVREAPAYSTGVDQLLKAAGLPR
jgi:L-ascorbate metabolism protein UlaG (beta-lactamase superfamily)